MCALGHTTSRTAFKARGLHLGAVNAIRWRHNQTSQSPRVILPSPPTYAHLSRFLKCKMCRQLSFKIFIYFLRSFFLFFFFRFTIRGWMQYFYVHAPTLLFYHCIYFIHAWIWRNTCFATLRYDMQIQRRLKHLKINCLMLFQGVWWIKHFSKIRFRHLTHILNSQCPLWNFVCVSQGDYEESTTFSIQK